jgi:homoserine kinase
LERNSRYATAFQNRLIKGLTSLAAMDQQEQFMAERSMTCLEYEDHSDEVVSAQLGNTELTVSDSDQKEE